MSDHSIAEAQEQCLKAAAYFGRVLEAHNSTHLAVEIDGILMVVARRSDRTKLEDALVAGLLGPDTVIGRRSSPPAEEGEPEQRMSAPPAAVGEQHGVTGSPPESTAELVPLYHVPGEEFKTAGHVHLHVTSDMTLGRRVRVKGECLCSKKKGSRQRAPAGETAMCGECVRVAAEHGLAWSLVHGGAAL